MSRIYTYSAARQQLATVLNHALTDGEVLIKRRDGTTFSIQPITAANSPLAVDGIDRGLTAPDLVQFVHEGRRFTEIEPPKIKDEYPPYIAAITHSLTIEQIPDALFQELQRTAAQNGRSLATELLARLEQRTN